MEKIKNILSSGHHNDEEVSHSSHTSSSQPAMTTSHAHQNANLLETDPEAKKHEHGVLRQLTNPGGDKYDQQGYGITAHSAGDHNAAPYKAPVLEDNTILRTDEEQKKHEHSILRQIINPGGVKYDQEGYGTTAHAVSDLPSTELNKLETTPAAQKSEHGVLRQILNPGGEKYDSQAFGTNADTIGHAAGVHGVTGTGVPAAYGDNASVSSIKSGVRGPYDQGAGVQASTPAAAHNTTAPLSDRSYERDGTLAGTAATAATVGGVAALRPRKADDDTALAINPIGDDVAVTGTGVTHGQAVQSQFSDPSAQTSHTAVAGNTHHDTLASTGPTSINPIGDDNFPTGTGVTHGQAIQGQHTTHNHPVQETPAAVTGNLQGEASTGLNHGQAVQRQYSGYIHRTQGPHPTDAGNIYDPSVPGSFPQDQALAGTKGDLSENRIPTAGKATELSHSAGHHENTTGTHGNTTSSAGAASAVYGTENHLDPKTERKLQQAREEVAAEGGDHGEKKSSLIQRILHPGHKTHESHGHEHASHTHDNPASIDAKQHQGPLLESRTVPEDISHGTIGPQ